MNQCYLVPNLQKFNKHFNNSLKRTQSQGKIILTENGDISQMYTALDHESILASLNWLLNLHFRRRGGVVIPKDPDQKPYFSNCITEPESGYFLSKQQILNITTFDQQYFLHMQVEPTSPNYRYRNGQPGPCACDPGLCLPRAPLP